MHIWTGCKLPEEFETQLRARCVPLSQELGLDISGFTLPQHISLKISFDAGEQHPEILEFIKEILQQEAPFTVFPAGIQQHGGILWITFRENETLRRLHDTLDSTLSQKYQIPQHMFDKQFFFHSALFLGDPETIARARAALVDISLPSELKIDTFLLGLSEEGTSGTFQIARQIEL